MFDDSGTALLLGYVVFTSFGLVYSNSNSSIASIISVPPSGLSKVCPLSALSPSTYIYSTSSLASLESWTISSSMSSLLASSK